MAFKGKPAAEFQSVAFGKWVRGTRESQGLRKDEFGAKAGLAPHTVRDVEIGDSEYQSREPAVELFARIARGLGVELGYVLHKAGFPVGKHDVNISRLERVEDVLRLLDEREPLLRRALAEAMESVDGSQADELGRALGSLDLITERLRDRR